MSLTAADQRDAGALIAKALDPKLRTGADPEYRRLLDRYRTVPLLRELVQMVLSGMDLVILAADDLGLVVAPARESVLSARLTDVPNTSGVENRTLFGVALVGIAAYAYPRREDLETERPRYVTVADVDEFLRRECEVLSASQGEADADAAGPADVAAWRVYARLAAQRSGERMGPKSSFYWVTQALTWLFEHGMARPERRGDVEHWILTERFRLHVADLAGTAAFDTLADLAAAAGTGAETLAPTPRTSTPRTSTPRTDEPPHEDASHEDASVEEDTSAEAISSDDEALL
jgi:hypothetical protein